MCVHIIQCVLNEYGHENENLVRAQVSFGILRKADNKPHC